MKRNSTTLFLESPGATTPVPWVNNAPDFSFFTEPTLSVLQNSWQAFLDSGEELEVISDPEPPSPAPDWTSFNMAMIPPTAESTFEVWLGQFKEPYRAALAVASSEGNTERVQGQYEILKDLAPPTAEQITEWQSIADRHNIGLTF